MIRLDQIKLLEGKVNRAVEQIRLLREENKALKRTVEKSQARMGELEGLVSRFKSDQDEIEQGILRALKNLDKLEDEVAARASDAKDGGAAQKTAAQSTADRPAAEKAPERPPAEKPAQEKRPPEKPVAEKPRRSAATQPAPQAEPEPPDEPVVDAGDDEADGGEQLDIF